MGGTAIDPKRFPALADYVGRLPMGLASYPTAVSRGIILRSAVSSHYFHATWKALPGELVSAIRSPPLATSWVSTAITDAVFCLVSDTFYPTREAMVQWNFDRTLRLASLPMYGPLARYAGLARFIEGAARFHAMFQKGTELRVAAQRGSATLRLEHPPHLHGALNHLSNEGVFRAALEAAGAKETKVELVESTPTLGRYEVSWKE